MIDILHNQIQVLGRNLHDIYKPRVHKKKKGKNTQLHIAGDKWFWF